MTNKELEVIYYALDKAFELSNCGTEYGLDYILKKRVKNIAFEKLRLGSSPCCQGVNFSDFHVRNAVKSVLLLLEYINDQKMQNCFRGKVNFTIQKEVNIEDLIE